MSINYEAITGAGLAGGFGLRAELPADAARALGLPGAGALRASLASRTTCLTMLAGAGTRWVDSLVSARERGDPLPDGADPDAPRGLFPVRNRLGFGPDPLPIAGYALAAVRDLGRHVIVVRGHERAIEDRVLRPLGYGPGSWIFVKQDAPGGKPRGHGDAAFQCIGSWRDGDYVLVNFGGDASSPLTALDALAVMDALSARLDDTAPGLVLPVARVKAPAYPVTLDADGRPVRFGHAKLGGTAAAPIDPEAEAYTNVGVRVYRADALADAILRMRRDHWTPEGSWSVPGNAPATDAHGGEFALDNVDALLASEGRARVLFVARPEELSPVKSLADVPRFVRDIEAVCGDWRLVPERSL